MDNITKQPNFWSENDDLGDYLSFIIKSAFRIKRVVLYENYFILVLKSIREGFLQTQQEMWGDLENWTKVRTDIPAFSVT
jgi:hypothetical protein